MYVRAAAFALAPRRTTGRRGSSSTSAFGIIVTVVNVGNVPIKNVKIEMSGKVYDLGKIDPGEWDTAFTYPNGMSGVRLVGLVGGVCPRGLDRRLGHAGIEWHYRGARRWGRGRRPQGGSGDHPALKTPAC